MCHAIGERERGEKCVVRNQIPIGQRSPFHKGRVKA